MIKNDLRRRIQLRSMVTVDLLSEVDLSKLRMRKTDNKFLGFQDKSKKWSFSVNSAIHSMSFLAGNWYSTLK